jgi:hypothetical protein
VTLIKGSNTVVGYSPSLSITGYILLVTFLDPYLGIFILVLMYQDTMLETGIVIVEIFVWLTFCERKKNGDKI